MKLLDIVFENVVELNELGTKPKEVYDRGAFHMIYQSKNNPNVLFKIGTQSMVDTWVDLFKSRPDIFPIVKRVGTTDYKFPKDFVEIDPTTYELIKHNAGDIVKIKYVEIEKLDVNRASIHWDRLDEVVKQISPSGKNLQIYLRSIGLEDSMEQEFIEIGNKLRGNKFIYDIFVDFYDLLSGVCELKPAADIHRRNFGYDKNFKLKMLDI